MWLKAEWFMSYNKALSRKQLARYYHIRQAIYEILTELMEAFKASDADKLDEKLAPFFNLFCISETDRADDSPMPEMKLKVFMILIRRLSAMHSSFVIENAEAIYDFYTKCRKQYASEEEYGVFDSSVSRRKQYQAYIKFPTEDVFCFNITKLIKWTAMSNYDDSKCFFIEKLYRDKVEGEKEKEGLQNIYRMAFLENVQILYHGVKRLMEGYDKADFKECEVRNYLQTLYENISNIKDEKNKYLMMNVNRYFFEFMDLRPYHKDEFNEVIRNKFASMVLYFTELRRLYLQKTIVSSPYSYEKLCNYMRDITDYHHCILVHDDGKPYKLATASIYEEYFREDLKGSG